MKGTAKVCVYARVLLMMSTLCTEDITAQEKGLCPSFLGRFGEALRSTGARERERAN